MRENQHLRSLADYALHLKQLHPYLCALPLASVHRGMLRPFIEARQKQGRKATSINLPLGLVRHILDMAAPEWLDEDNLTSLATPPKIKLLKVRGSRANPLSWDEQARLFQQLPKHLAACRC